jgi:hypothetical protein
MRLMNICLGLSMLVSPMLMAQGPATPPCDGMVVITRVSAVKPGMMSKFLEASAANLAWYRTNGVTTNQIGVGKVAKKDGSGWSDTEALTYHLNPPGPEVKLPRNDAGWKAFVKMFDESSTIKATYVTCAPKMM